jgi:alpha-L-arabinofuranosidase
MKKVVFSVVCACFAMACMGQDVYTVSTKQVKARVPETLWGLFFEDINRAADGGVYAEMVLNNSFDFPKPLTAWQTWKGGIEGETGKLRDGVILAMNQMATNASNPKYMHIATTAEETVGLINSGFEEGMSFKKGAAYRLTLRYRQIVPGINIHIFLLNADNRPVGDVSVQLAITGNRNWQEQQMTVVTSDSATRGKLLVIFNGAGKMDLDRVSLFPVDTWRRRPGGLRADLVQKLADLNPGFFRFPGGCIVEGNQLVERYQWKNTIGPLEDREPAQNIWGYGKPDRQKPDYRQSFGLGFFEYFQLSEDIGATPMPIVNAGLSCQFDEAEVVPMDEMEPYIKDALDLIEFANGDISTYWGKKRADLGHPQSFNMQYLGIGNENWGPQYTERLDIFTKRIKEKYPYIELIYATGYSLNIPVFNYMDSVLRARKVDIIDEHFYGTTQWFIENAVRYDSYDRNGPKIFVGEYAAQSERIGSVNNRNTLYSALSEACFMTGIERNADIVTMSCYAPLFAHVTGWQWTPNLIWFDNETSYVTPNYWVQSMFSNNKGTEVVSIDLNKEVIAGQDSIWASAMIDRKANEMIVKLVNMNGVVRTKQVSVADSQLTGKASITTLTANDPNRENALRNQNNIKPETKTISAGNKAIEVNLPPYSLNVIRVKLKK